MLPAKKRGGRSRISLRSVLRAVLMLPALLLCAWRLSIALGMPRRSGAPQRQWYASRNATVGDVLKR